MILGFPLSYTSITSAKAGANFPIILYGPAQYNLSLSQLPGIIFESNSQTQEVGGAIISKLYTLYTLLMNSGELE